jgi:hypothetical protein
MTYIQIVQGAEFDAVKSLKEDRVHFKGKPWFHINFLARSRSSKNIKTFFAEVHYEPPTDGKPFSRLPVVEACIILGMFITFFSSQLLGFDSFNYC